MLLSLGVTVNAEEQTADAATAEENKLYCLTNNNWTESDLELYQERAGFKPENIETKATYYYESDCDIMGKQHDPDCTSMFSGQISKRALGYMVWGGWRGEQQYANDYFNIVVDLGDDYWVSMVDIWDNVLAEGRGMDTLQVSVGLELDSLMTLPAVQLPRESADVINAANASGANAYPNRGSVEFQAVNARYVKLTTKRYSYQQNPAEIAIFGYVDKPTQGSGEVLDEYVQPEGETLAAVKNPDFDKYNTYVIDLGEVKRVSGVDVTEYTSAINGLKEYEVWLSDDGYSYAEAAVSYPVSYTSMGETTINTSLAQLPYARYVKVVAKAHDTKQGYKIRSIEVLGTEGAAQERIDANATYSYWEQHPYQTNTDIKLQDKDLTVLMDGDKESYITTNDKWATVVIDLGDAYQIGNVDIYSLANETHFMEGAEIRYSLDNKKWFTYTYYVNNNEKTGGIVKSSFCGQPGRNARYLKIIAQSQDHAISLSEIEVNGYKVTQPRASTPPQVPLRIEMKNFLLAYFDWSTYNNDNASKYSIYIEKYPFTNVSLLTPKATYERFDNAFQNKYTTYQPLEPETTYYFAVTAYDDYGVENKAVTPVKVVTDQVLGDEVGEAFNITHHPTMVKNPFGGQKEAQNADIIRLYDELGASNKTSGWVSTGTDKFAEIGVGVTHQSFTAGAAGITKGAWFYTQGNESDLSAVPAETYIARNKTLYNQIKSADSRTVMGFGRMGGVDDKCINWLDSCYAYDAAGVREYSDTLDVHLYPKSGYEQIPGLPTACPELLPWMVARVRSVMDKYGDYDKPITCTEGGYMSTKKAGYAAMLTHEQVAQYVPRLYMLAISEGVREWWYYAFQDEGVDRNDTEQCWGLVDYFGVPKAQYYSYYNTYYQLRHTDYLGAVAGLSTPYYGFNFYDETKGKIISSAWAADGKEKTLTFETLSGEDELVEVITYDGGFQTIQTKDGEGSVLIGAGPVYIYSKAGIKATSTARAFELVESSKTASKGQDISFSITRGSLGGGISGYISAQGLPSGWTLVGETAFTAEQAEINVTVRVASAASDGVQSFTLKAIMDDGRVENIEASIDVKPYMSVEFVPEPVTFGDWDHWRIAANCTNTATIPVEGKLSLLNATGIKISTIEAQYTGVLQPGETATVYFDVTERVAINSDGVGSFALEVNGETTMIDRVLNFTACVNDGITPVIDGQITGDEYANCDVIHIEQADDRSDCSADIYRKWDDTNFYLLVDVTDNIFYQPYKDSEIWGADGLQIAIDFARKEGVGAQNSDEYFEIGVAAEENTMKPLTWAWFADLIIKTGRPMTGYECVITRDEDTKHTIYEIAIPWAYLMNQGSISDYKMCGFSLLVNDGDNDGGPARTMIAYRNGIGNGKNPQVFEDMVFVKK